MRFLGIEGIERILNESLLKKSNFIEKLDKNKFKVYSGPLHIVSFLPKNMDTKESNNWTMKTKNILLEKNFMISRPFYKGKFYLRIVFGNFNTTLGHVLELSNLLNLMHE